MTKEPSSVQDEEVRKAQLEVAILLNYGEKYNWDHFSNDEYEERAVSALETRKNRAFQRGFERTREFSKFYLDDVVVDIMKRLVTADITTTAQEYSAPAQGYHRRIEFSPFNDCEICYVDTRIKEALSYARKFVRMPRDQEKYHESGRYDLWGVEIITQCDEAREYMMNSKWDCYNEKTNRYIINAGRDFFSGRIEHRKVKGKKDDAVYKILNKGHHMLKARRKKKPMKPWQKCEEMCEFLQENEVVLAAERGYRQLVRRTEVARTYANLNIRAKEHYAKKFNKANQELIRSIASVLIEDKSWITIPYGPIVMKLDIPKKQDLEKEVAIQSQVVMSRSTSGETRSFDVDYLLFNTAMGANEFIKSLGIHPNPKHDKVPEMHYGTRIMGDDKQKNFAMFSKENLVVYSSFDGPLDSFKRFMKRKMDNLGTFSEIIDKKFEGVYEHFNKLEKATNDAIKYGKNRVVHEGKTYDHKKWKKNIYDVQKDILKKIILRNNEINPMSATVRIP